MVRICATVSSSNGPASRLTSSADSTGPAPESLVSVTAIGSLRWSCRSCYIAVRPRLAIKVHRTPPLDHDLNQGADAAKAIAFFSESRSVGHADGQPRSGLLHHRQGP